jgi:hypothetical protein
MSQPFLPPFSLIQPPDTSPPLLDPSEMPPRKFVLPRNNDGKGLLPAMKKHREVHRRCGDELRGE